METVRNGTATPRLPTLGLPSPGGKDGNAYLYIIIVVSFYGVFLLGITFGYLRSKRNEKRRTNAFTRLLHEEEERAWGASQKKHSFSFPSIHALRSTPVTLVMPGRYPGRAPLCPGEQSSISSLSSTNDVRFTIEEEPGPEEPNCSVDSERPPEVQSPEHETRHLL